MKQTEIISQMPSLFAQSEGIKVALLIGSFARKETTSKSDMDYLMWVDQNSFVPSSFVAILKNKLPNILKIAEVGLRNRVVVYFSDCPKLELVWYEQITDLNRNFLGSEIPNIEDSIAYQQAGLEIDLKAYLTSIVSEKKYFFATNGKATIARELTEKFIYEFESASNSHKRSDSYKHYFSYNIALHVAIQLNYLSTGKTEHYYLPKNFAHIYQTNEEQLFFRALNGTLYLPDVNKKKRDLLSFFYAAIEKLNVHSTAEISEIRNFLEHVYSRDFIWNFRDAATFKRRQKSGKIYRASSLTRYQDEPFFPEFISRHKISKIVDLRDKDEYADSPYNDESLQLFEHLHLSIDPRQQSEDFIKNYHYGTNHQIAYRHFAVGHRHIFKAIFEQINPENDVFLVHCHAGKDRTGCIIALFGLFCGEDLESIFKEYYESEMDTSAENLNAFLEILSKEGGVENFLLNCNISQDTLNHWKKHLTYE